MYVIGYSCSEENAYVLNETCINANNGSESSLQLLVCELKFCIFARCLYTLLSTRWIKLSSFFPFGFNSPKIQISVSALEVLIGA